MLSTRSPHCALTELRERRVAGGEGLLIEATVSPDSPVLPAFYAGYDAAFVLPNEKEGYEGFAQCLALNSGEPYARLADLYGAFREVVLVAREPDGGALVGGANFIAFPLQLDAEVLSINLNYIFVSSEQRRRGHFKRLLQSVGEVAAAFFEPAVARLARRIFIEQNDPMQMSRADYARDTEHAGIDQLTRIRLWTTLGAKIIDFAYVQLPLSGAQAPDHSLLYAVLGAEGSTLDACLLHAHLTRFFAISVLKGSDPLANGVAGAQLAELAARCGRKTGIPLLTAASLPPLMDGSPDASVRRSLRELIRTPA